MRLDVKSMRLKQFKYKTIHHLRIHTYHFILRVLPRARVKIILPPSTPFPKDPYPIPSHPNLHPSTPSPRAP